jgi:hypothetical protein
MIIFEQKKLIYFFRQTNIFIIQITIMFLSSSASVTVGTEKEYVSSSCGMKNPELVQHCQKLLLLSLMPHQPSSGLFQELENTVACCYCHKQSFFIRIIEKTKKREKESLATSDEALSVGSESCLSCPSSQECYCVLCYVDKFCNVHTFQNHDGSETHYIFKEKGSSGGILYQSSSIIQRLASSSSD